MVDGPTIAAFDGVALRRFGDIVLVVYALPARIHRTRWLFDHLDALVAKSAGPLSALMVILPSADPPDAETRAENDRRLKPLLRDRMSLLVTVAIGDAVRTMLIRTVMRGMFLLQGQSRLQCVASTLDEGFAKLAAHRGAGVPRARVREQLRAMSEQLAVDAAWAHDGPFVGPTL